MIGGQGEDSCGKSGTGQPLHEEAHRPRKAKSCTEINSGVTSRPDHLSNLFVFRVD
ncbi:hypothetical protein [Priestia megaterium]|uniref:hypothetical protein n=1 Tax=Priestia megaterium TaxID=1404 RepID=UPI001864425D|nr:hypothetical protein [Priestia megaterium]MDH3172687.1 hypothetical protein [Priestia megaterium]